MNKLNKKDFEYDFDYIIKFLKENSPYAHIINFDNLEKQKEKVCNVDNIIDFIENLYYLYWKGLDIKKTGHNGPTIVSKEFKDFFDKTKIHYKFFNKYQNEIFYKEDYFKLKEKLNKKNNDNKKNNNKKIEKIYDCRIIKDNKNNDCIYIKIRKMINPNDKEYNELRKFLIKNKKLENIYIDIRGNSGGNSYCYSLLLKLIYNKKLKFYHNNIKIYFKNTKYNKIWINDCLNCYELNKSSNKNFTHYIIQKLDKNMNYYNNKDYIGFKGHIYIIIDKSNFSSSQMLLDETKGNEDFTILGNEKSSGSGWYGSVSCCNASDNFYFILPKTKILFIYEKYYYNHNKYLTEPDKPIPKFLMKKEFLN